MNTQHFKVGDVVSLKTSRLQMVITEIDDYTGALCEWQDKSGRPQKESYPLVALEHWRPPIV